METLGLILLVIAGFMATGSFLPSVRDVIGSFALYLAILLAPAALALLLMGATQPAADIPTYVTALVVTIIIACTGGLIFLIHRLR